MSTYHPFTSGCCFYYVASLCLNQLSEVCYENYILASMIKETRLLANRSVVTSYDVNTKTEPTLFWKLDLKYFVCHGDHRQILLAVLIAGRYCLQLKKAHFFQGPTIQNSRDQCASFEPLVDPFGPGPPTHGQSGLSGLVVGGQKMHDSHAPSDSKKNACQDQAKKR